MHLASHEENALSGKIEYNTALLFQCAIHVSFSFADCIHDFTLDITEQMYTFADGVPVGSISNMTGNTVN